MYFDAVTNAANDVVHFNGTPFEVRAWLKAMQFPEDAPLIVWTGRDLRAYSIAEYLQKGESP
jgi:hypothetical protein